jgi:aryl-alcohol dehydrogenase-like predicted oxidoreductase
MPRLGKTGLQVSALGLGTAGIGFVYGIGPRTSPTEQGAIEVLCRAVDLGIHFIDTGASYGIAEECIGKSGIAKRPGVVVSTKCGHILDRREPITPEEMVVQFREEVETSLRRLRIDCVPLLQVHGGTAEQIQSGAISYVTQRLKTEGKIAHAGISTRGEEAPLAAIADGHFETLQLAHSILDQRMAKRVFAAVKAADIGILNRSVLLKGALTPARAALGPQLQPLRSNADKAEAIAAELGVSLPELAIRFCLSNASIDTVLVGSNKIANLEKAAAAVAAGPLPEAVLARLRPLGIDDPLQVDPKSWDNSAFVADTKVGKAAPTASK